MTLNYLVTKGIFISNMFVYYSTPTSTISSGHFDQQFGRHFRQAKLKDNVSRYKLSLLGVCSYVQCSKFGYKYEI